ncbi:MAG TPA: histidine phosphatase family protein [Noviherbaspirillum sp.]|nr:histidine phosphatase family protein [Noviherbaspirillum sp.]
MTEILIIRHGETAWNAVRRLQGHLDIPLSAEGERQAAALAHALRDEPLDAIYSSDLRRARQTAEAVARARGMTIIVEPGLRERSFGGFEGLLYAEIGARYPAEFAAWKAREFDAGLPPGERAGETLREFFERTVGAVRDILMRDRHRRVAMFTHGGVLECVHRAAQGLRPDRPRDFDILNAGINRLHWDGNRLHLLSWGEVEHLRAERLAALDEIDR